MPQIEAGRESLGALRRKRHAQAVAVRRLGPQIWIAALDLRKLTRRTLRDRVGRAAVAVRRRKRRGLIGSHRVQALLQVVHGGNDLEGGTQRRRTRICADRDLADELRVEELDDARRADRLVQRRAQPNGGDRCVLDLELGRIHRPARRIIRAAYAGVEAEILNVLLAFEQRNAYFGEIFVDADRPVDGHGRARESR